MRIPLHWHTEPLLLLLVVGASWAYSLACGPFRQRCLPGREAYPVGYAVRFHLGVLVGYLAVGSPLDQLGEGFLFSAHMLQHMLLIYVAAPLLVALLLLPAMKRGQGVQQSTAAAALVTLAATQNSAA